MTELKHLGSKHGWTYGLDTLGLRDHMNDPTCGDAIGFLDGIGQYTGHLSVLSFSNRKQIAHLGDLVRSRIWGSYPTLQCISRYLSLKLGSKHYHELSSNGLVFDLCTDGLFQVLVQCRRLLRLPFNNGKLKEDFEVSKIRLLELREAMDCYRAIRDEKQLYLESSMKEVIRCVVWDLCDAVAYLASFPDGEWVLYGRACLMEKVRHELNTSGLDHEDWTFVVDKLIGIALTAVAKRLNKGKDDGL